MPEEDAYLIEKIASHEAEVMVIYQEVYSLLHEADPATLPNSVAAELPRFDHPNIVEPAKAAAILKAMLGSSSSDKFLLEGCYQVPMAGGQSVSGFVRGRLHELGIEYHDFWPYLRSKGWLNEIANP